MVAGHAMVPATNHVDRRALLHVEGAVVLPQVVRRLPPLLVPLLVLLAVVLVVVLLLLLLLPLPLPVRSALRALSLVRSPLLLLLLVSLPLLARGGRPLCTRRQRGVRRYRATLRTLVEFVVW